MYCPGCGSEVEAGALLCPFCGTSLPLETKGGLTPIEDSAPDYAGAPAFASAWETALPDERYLNHGEGSQPVVELSPSYDTPNATFTAYCMECGTGLPDGAEFCPVCGVRAGATAETIVPAKGGGWRLAIVSVVGLILGGLAAWLLLGA